MLADLVRFAVDTARELTPDLQVMVSVSSYTGQNLNGKETFATPVEYKAIWDRAERYAQSSTGQTVLIKHAITFLEPFIIKIKDKVVLPDGTTGPVLDIKGVVDPSTNAPYVPEVWLG